MPDRPKILAGFLATCWVASLALPVAFMGPKPNQVFPGALILMIGVLGPLAGQFGWLANPMLLIALIFIARGPRAPRTNAIVAGALLTPTLCALTWHEMYSDNGTAPVHSFGPGYYLWFATMFGAIAALIYNAIQADRAEG